jgi:uncharacterized integral membrane protein
MIVLVWITLVLQVCVAIMDFMIVFYTKNTHEARASFFRGFLALPVIIILVSILGGVI